MCVLSMVSMTEVSPLLCVFVNGEHDCEMSPLLCVFCLWSA